MLFIKGNKLYTIQWLNDKEIIVTTGYQIGASSIVKENIVIQQV